MSDDFSAGKSKSTFTVVGERKESKALKTFDDVNLYPGSRDQKETYVWNFVKSLQTRPYETTLQTFSKLSEIICKYFTLTSCKR